MHLSPNDSSLPITQTRLAFADTRHFVADPEQNPAPLEALLSPEYAAERTKVRRMGGNVCVSMWLIFVGETAGYGPNRSHPSNTTHNIQHDTQDFDLSKAQADVQTGTPTRSSSTVSFQARFFEGRREKERHACAGLVCFILSIINDLSFGSHTHIHVRRWWTRRGTP